MCVLTSVLNQHFYVPLHTSESMSIKRITFQGKISGHEPHDAKTKLCVFDVKDSYLKVLINTLICSTSVYDMCNEWICNIFIMHAYKFILLIYKNLQYYLVQDIFKVFQSNYDFHLKSYFG